MIYYLFSPMGKSWPQEETERSSRWGAPNENLLDRGPLLPSRAVYPSSAQVGKKGGGRAGDSAGSVRKEPHNC